MPWHGSNLFLILTLSLCPQLACLGTLVQSFVTLPDPVFANGARPQAAFAQLAAERPIALLQIILFLVGVELTAGKQDDSKAPGELGRLV